MKKLWLILFAFPFLAVKCDPDPQPILCLGTFNLNFKPIFNNKPFVINTVYEVNGKKVRFSKFHFYVSSIENTGAASDCNNPDDVVFVNMTTLDDSTKAANGFSSTIKNRGVGNFQQLKMTLGINPTLNGKTPQDFVSSNPLSNSDEYWSSWKSYIFFKLEGLMDKDNNGTFETGVTYHAGSNEVTQSITIPKSYEIKNTEPAFMGGLSFEVDVNKLLNGFDLNTLNKIENLSQKEDMKKLMNNLSLSLK
jgi:hypothetical protein